MKFFIILVTVALWSSNGFAFFGTLCTTYDSNEPPYSLTLRCQKKGDSLFVDGGIDEFLYDEIYLWDTPGYKVKGQLPIKKVYLNSRGGKMFSTSDYSFTAEQAIEIIQEKKLETHVLKDKVCLSACVPIFVSGKVRAAAPTAKFMVHSPRFSQSYLALLKDKCGPKLEELKCKDEIKGLKKTQFEQMDRYFSLIEQLGANKLLRKDYLKGERDERAPGNGNLIGIEDFYFTGVEALKYRVALKNSN